MSTSTPGPDGRRSAVTDVAGRSRPRTAAAVAVLLVAVAGLAGAPAAAGQTSDHADPGGVPEDGPAVDGVVVVVGDEPGFVPAEVDLEAGEVVTFVWAEDGHAVRHLPEEGDEPAFDSHPTCGTVDDEDACGRRGDTVVVVLEEPGTYAFGCPVHEELRGVLRVSAAAPGPPDTGTAPPTAPPARPSDPQPPATADERPTAPPRPGAPAATADGATGGTPGTARPDADDGGDRVAAAGSDTGPRPPARAPTARPGATSPLELPAGLPQDELTAAQPVVAPPQVRTVAPQVEPVRAVPPVPDPVVALPVGPPGGAPTAPIAFAVVAVLGSAFAVVRVLLAGRLG